MMSDSRIERMSDFSRRAGLNYDNLRKQAERDSLTRETVEKISSFYGYAFRWVMSGDGPMKDGAPAIAGDDVQIMSSDDFAMVPVYDVRAAAGAGAVNHNAKAISLSAFRWDWLRSRTSAPTDRLAVIQVEGDSMEPTLHHKDHVLIDTTVSKYTRDGLYVIRYEVSDEAMVKRLMWDPTSGTFTIKSDNPTYGPMAGVPPAAIVIIGRVLWLGRNVG